MSGLDEQHNDIPECPKCGETPDYWSVQNSGRAAIWFYSKHYREGDLGEPYNAYVGEGHFKILKDVKHLNFHKATCMGETDSGCSKTTIIDDEPGLFGIFWSMYKKYFPDKIFRTD